MDKDLEAKINERKQQSIDHKVFEKASRIAHTLGESKYGNRSSDGADTVCTFEQGFLKIRYIFPFKSLISISFNNQEVYYSADHDIKSYLPGEWENLLNSIYEKMILAETHSREIEKTESQKREEQEANDLKKKFGL